MCALCGVFLTETHWTDASVFAGPGGAAGTGMGGRTRRHERLHGVALANRVLKQRGLKLTDWNGSAYLLGNQTGQTAIVASIAAVWPAVERLGKQPIDPLDEHLIEVLERG